MSCRCSHRWESASGPAIAGNALMDRYRGVVKSPVFVESAVFRVSVMPLMGACAFSCEGQGDERCHNAFK